MLNSKDKPVGVDIPVEGFSAFLYEQLKALWQLSDSQLDAYGRCYRNKIDKGYTPQLFVPSSKRNNTLYRDIDFDDQNTTALYFFDEGDSLRQTGTSSIAKMDLIFIVNLAKAKPDLLHRGDEEVRVDVERLVRMPRYGFKMTEMILGYKNVFSRFDALLTNDQVSFRDSHPIHVFKISFDLVYNPTAC